MQIIKLRTVNNKSQKCTEKHRGEQLSCEKWREAKEMSYSDRGITRVVDCGNLSSRRGSLINLLLQLRADHCINGIPYLAISLAPPPRRFISELTSCPAVTNTRPDIFIIAKNIMIQPILNVNNLSL